jgi:hypothetical protein
MSTEKPPIGSTASDGGRPRAQVAYEGEDEFSTRSLDPKRRETTDSHGKRLKPDGVGKKDQIKIDDLKPTNEKGAVGFLRKIFPK